MTQSNTPELKEALALVSRNLTLHAKPTFAAFVDGAIAELTDLERQRDAALAEARELREQIDRAIAACDYAVSTSKAKDILRAALDQARKPLSPENQQSENTNT